MPRYDFRCRVCNQIFEMIAPVEEPLQACVYCNPPNPLAFADRQLCFPAHIQVN